MDKISTYDYSELDIGQEQKLFDACLVEGIEGFTIELDGDNQTAKIIFN